MNILVLGGAGYLGSVLVETLLKDDGNTVVVIDNFQHDTPSLAHLCSMGRLIIRRRDVLTLQPLDIDGYDVVFPLAAVVGANACLANTSYAIKLNQLFIYNLLQYVDKHSRVIFPCTNSGYGISGPAECSENSPLEPISVYGTTKVNAEKAVMQRPNSVSLRLATLFGWSPRMRRDLLVNDMVWRAVRDRSVLLFEGHFRRNFCHVRDAALAFTHVLSNWDAMKNQVYNVGDTRANMTKLQLCEKIRTHVPEFHFRAADHANDPDRRDYIVSNAKIEATGWAPTYTIDHGIAELVSGYRMLKGEQYGNN